MRLFRLDRVVAVDVLEHPIDLPETATGRDLADGLFRPSADHDLVVLDVAPSARWVADYYPCESVEDLAEPAGWQRLGLRVADPAWVVRLVLRLGADARIVSPAGLSTSVKDRAAAALSAYGGAA